MEDRIAISRLKQGDLNSLETLVNRYQARAVYAAYLILFDRAQAEDVAQTAFIKVVEHIHQFDERRLFAPWFFRIVVNDALKATHKQKLNVSLEELDESTSHLAQWLLDPTPQPESVLEEKQIREHILQAIQSLSLEQRAVIVMRYYLDMTEADICAEMNRPLSTVKWWLRDARKHLRRLIDDHFMRGVKYE